MNDVYQSSDSQYMIYFHTEDSAWALNFDWSYQQGFLQQLAIGLQMNCFQWSYPNVQIGNYSYQAPIFLESQIQAPKIPQLEQNQIMQVDQFNEQEEEEVYDIVRQRFKVKYVKKNAESNVINRIFSYLSMRSKSQDTLKNILKGNMEKINIYYEVMRQIRKKNKKYINRRYLKELIELVPDHIGAKSILNLDKEHILGKQEMKRILRVLINNYMKDGYVNSILTSTKLDKATKYEHVKRGKTVLSYLINQIKI